MPEEFKKNFFLKTHNVPLNASPCISCTKILLEAGIRQMYYVIDYPDEEFKGLYKEAGIKYTKICYRGDMEYDG